MDDPKINGATFSAVLAASVHDLKNSLWTVQRLLKQLGAHQATQDLPEIRELQTEAAGMNDRLMQLLILYRIDANLFSPMVDVHSVADIVADVAARYESVLSINNITLNYSSTEDAYCFCDNALIISALGAAVNNAQRYCRRHIALTASSSNGQICFSVEDDGPGFPAEILLDWENRGNPLDLGEDKTGLGLHLSRLIADLHSTDKQPGYAAIDNNSGLGGARFRLILP